MNERLKELGIQAGGIWIEHATAFLSGTLNLERFAELVRQDYLNELKALKPVAWQVMDENNALREFSIKNIAQDWITTELLRGSSIVYWIQPLYALDEVTK